MYTVRGTVKFPDNTLIFRDGTIRMENGTVRNPDGRLKRAAVKYPNGAIRLADGNDKIQMEPSNKTPGSHVAIRDRYFSFRYMAPQFFAWSIFPSPLGTP
jgi:hypothetical protein